MVCLFRLLGCGCHKERREEATAISSGGKELRGSEERLAIGGREELPLVAGLGRLCLLGVWEGFFRVKQ